MRTLWLILASIQRSDPARPGEASSTAAAHSTIQEKPKRPHGKSIIGFLRVFIPAPPLES